MVWAVNGVVVDDRDHYLRILRNFTLGGQDSALIISSSGTNIVPIEMAATRRAADASPR